MRTLKLLAVNLLAVIALGAMTASAAAAKTVLVLKEEGKPVASGTEVRLELETSFHQCKLTQPARLSVNRATKDKIRTELPEIASCPQPEHCCAAYDLRGPMRDLVLSGAGIASVKGWPMTLTLGKVVGPAPTCEYRVAKYFGAFPIPGHAVIEGSATGELNKRESTEGDLGEQCGQSESTSFAIAVVGHNGKPLETELTTHH